MRFQFVHNNLKNVVYKLYKCHFVCGTKHKDKHTNPTGLGTHFNIRFKAYKLFYTDIKIKKYVKVFSGHLTA